MEVKVNVNVNVIKSGGEKTMEEQLLRDLLLTSDLRKQICWDFSRGMNEEREREGSDQ